jgi:hypothetical protein
LKWILENDPTELDLMFCIDEENFGQVGVAKPWSFWLSKSISFPIGCNTTLLDNRKQPHELYMVIITSLLVVPGVMPGSQVSASTLPSPRQVREVLGTSGVGRSTPLLQPTPAG